MCRCLAGPALVFNRNGFPWPEETICYHATTALSKILDHGFKTRSEVGIHATGGGPDRAISLTLTQGIADAICIGLATLHRGARWQLNTRTLYEQLKSTCPVGVREALKNTTADEHAPATLASLDMIDRGFHGQSFYMTQAHELPPGSVPIRSDQIDGRTWVYAAWVPNHLLKDEWSRTSYMANEGFARFYKAVLHFGDSAEECYNPLFFMTRMEDMAKLDLDDIGVLITRVHLPRICVDPRSAYEMGYISRNTAQRFASFLSNEYNKCGLEVDSNVVGRYPPSASEMYLQPYTMDDWEVVDEGERLPEDTIVYHNAMNELRVYAPRRIEILDHYTLGDLQRRAPNAFVHPWFPTISPKIYP